MKYILLSISLVLGILFSTTVLAQNTNLRYNEAYVGTFGNGKPMAIYIGATWCNPCNQMKAGPLKLIKSNTIIKHFNYLELDVDADKDLVKSFSKGSKINELKIPHILFVQRDGKIRVVEGYIDYSKLESIFRSEANFYGQPIQP